MEELLQECYVVFVRAGTWPAQSAEAVEYPLEPCFSYQDAARIKQNLRGSGKSCIIRSIGQSGGGD
jgi:hypothetical protein